MILLAWDLQTVITTAHDALVAARHSTGGLPSCGWTAPRASGRRLLVPGGDRTRYHRLSGLAEGSEHQAQRDQLSGTPRLHMSPGEGTAPATGHPGRSYPCLSAGRNIRRC